MGLRRGDPTDVGSERRRTLLVTGVLAAVAGLASLDLASDVHHGGSLEHALMEALIVLLGVAGLAVLLCRLRELRRQGIDARADADALGRALELSRAESERWRKEAGDLLAGLGALIDEQFGRWNLSAAEKEVALLLLKGLSHKEVAQARSVSEATARQQATAVYRKAGVAGRHDLAAFFLEDLLAPRAGR